VPLKVQYQHLGKFSESSLCKPFEHRRRTIQLGKQGLTQTPRIGSSSQNLITLISHAEKKVDDPRRSCINHQARGNLNEMARQKSKSKNQVPSVSQCLKQGVLPRQQKNIREVVEFLSR